METDDVAIAPAETAEMPLRLKVFLPLVLHLLLD